MAETKTKKRVVTKINLRVPNASAIIGEIIAELPSIKVERLVEPTVVHYDKKQTHKSTEPKARPRSYRFGVSVEKRLKKAKRLLGATSETDFVEGAIIAACRKLGV